MKIFLQNNISEIQKDPVLRWYGVFLSLTHVISCVFWKIELARFLSNEVAPICWPFWEACHRYRFFDDSQVQSLLNGYLLISVLVALLFVNPKWTKHAWWSLVLLTVLKLAIISVDFRLRGNAHYMALLATLAFLFLPSKRTVLCLLVAFFYFWSGTLKLNSVWLTGQALYRPLWLIRGDTIPWACAYVVVLELLLVWGLFSEKAWIFWSTLLQVLVFHVMSWPLVGFLYPTVMFALLTIYPLSRPSPVSSKVSPNEFLRLLKGRQRATTYAALGILGLLQIQAYFFPGDSSLTGEGRFLSLDMFDDRIECEAYAESDHDDGSLTRHDLVTPMPPRIRCDPIVYFNRANLLCRNLKDSGSKNDFSLILNSRRIGERKWKSVIDQKRFCASGLHYDLWRHNSWIRPVSL